MEPHSIARTRQLLCQTSNTSVFSSSLRRLALVMPRSVLVRRLHDYTVTTYHNLTSHSSQPEFARSARVPDPFHPDRPLAVPVPRRPSAVHPHRSHRRLLLLRMYCYDYCRSCGVRSGKQYVVLIPLGGPPSSDTDNDSAFPFAVFIIYGSHWGSLAYNQDPIHGISSAFATEGGANGAPYQSSQVFHNLTM
jgi:hypothetical protein